MKLYSKPQAMSLEATRTVILVQKILPDSPNETHQTETLNCDTEKCVCVCVCGRRGPKEVNSGTGRHAMPL